jgi:hypothetical protein
MKIKNGVYSLEMIIYHFHMTNIILKKAQRYNRYNTTGVEYITLQKCK